MKRFLSDWSLALIASLSVLGILAWLSLQPSVPVDAPDFSIQTTDGEEFVLSDHRGQVVVVNFWATWCGPCLREIPEFSEFADQNPDVRLIGVAVRSDTGTVLRMADEIAYPLAIPTAASNILDDYGMNNSGTVFPTTFIIDANGQIVGDPIRRAIDYDQLEEAVAAAMNAN